MAWILSLVIAIEFVCWQVAGAERTAHLNRETTQNPFYTVVDLGTLGGTNSTAFGINNKGQIVGAADTKESSETSGRMYRAFSYENGKIKDLGGMGGKWSEATGINETGTIVGQAIDQVGCLIKSESFVIENGRMLPLKLSDQYHTSIRGLNNAGHYCGLGNFKGVIRTFFYDGELKNLGGYAITNRSEAFGINDAGDVAGISWISNRETRAFLWSNGEMINLGMLPGDFSSGARDVNNHGVVVGWSSPRSTSGSRAVLIANGRIHNLNELIAANSGWVLLEANGINDLGQIVGTGEIGGKKRAFLLSPRRR
jgi:probable HAF family extracellular repeat protein